MPGKAKVTKVVRPSGFLSYLLIFGKSTLDPRRARAEGLQFKSFFGNGLSSGSPGGREGPPFGFYWI
jgi:hypothetical protein